MRGSIPDELVLAIYATSKGFAFVLFEGPESPFDWGVRDISNPSRNRKCVDAIAQIIEQYQPGVLVIEDTTERLSRRTARIRRLYQSITHVANTHVMDVQRIQKDGIRQVFGSVGAVTKFEIAQAIAIQIPAFAIRLPKVRKAWMSQDSRQSLFDAAALGIVYYASRGLIPSPYMDGDSL